MRDTFEQKFNKKHPIITNLIVGIIVFSVTKYIFTPHINDKKEEYRENNKVRTIYYIENKGYTSITNVFNIIPKEDRKIDKVEILEGKENVLSQEQIDRGSERVVYKLSPDEKVKLSIISSDSVTIAPAFGKR